MTLLDIRRLTVEDYYRMAEAGILEPDERVELIEGQIIKMAAKGTAHEAAITRTDLLLRLLGNQVLIRLHSPIRLDNFSEPEPDIAVVSVDPLDYEDRHPVPSEVYLVIEVADTSLKIDRQIKAPVYARSGILDYWVLDVSDRHLHVFREPSQENYQSEVILSDDANISPLAFPDITIAVRNMLRPLS